MSNTDREGTVLKINGQVSLSKIDNFIFFKKILTSTGEINATLDVVLVGFNISEKVVQRPVNGSEDFRLSYVFKKEACTLFAIAGAIKLNFTVISSLILPAQLQGVQLEFEKVSKTRNQIQLHGKKL